MSIIKFLDQIDTDAFDKDGKDKFLSRKDALSKLSNFSKNLALSAVPLGAIAAFAPSAMAQSGNNDIAILNYALTLEFLEKEFYVKGVDSGVIPSGNDTTIFTQIRDHEIDHVAFLLDQLGDQAIQKPTFDFTAGGQFDPFNENGTGQATAYAQFQILSQGFEDTGVRAYKGQAANIADRNYLSAALRIHSVEARHASQVRRLRDPNQKGWITGAGVQAPDPIAAVYASGSTFNLSEGNTNQSGVDVSTLVSANAGTESFDEPLGMDAVNAIAGPFIVS